MKIGIIGIGHLGRSFAKGLIKSGFNASDIIANARTLETFSKVKELFPGVITTIDKAELIEKSDIIVIAVKPKDAVAALSGIADLDFAGKTIITFMAGITLKDMRKMLHDDAGTLKIVRVMPNVAISLCNGITGISYDKDEKDIEEIIALFRRLGMVISLPEEELDTVTVCAGSGPAFAAYLMREYKNACNKMFKDEKISEEVAIRVFESTLQLMKEDKDNFNDVITKVATKGGSTEKGIEKYEETDLTGIIYGGIEASYERISKLK